MTVTTNGQTIKRFMNDDAFWGDLCIEEATYTVNGVEVDTVDAHDLKDQDVVVITYGYVGGGSEDSQEYIAFFKRWLSTQTEKHLLISVPNEKEADLRKLIEEFGAKILG